MLLVVNGFVFRASHGAPKKHFSKTCSLHLLDAVQGFGISQQVFCNAKMVFVYTKTLLAGAMKPLNVLSKFENHFANQTVRFQVQLEADGYFLLRRFLRLHSQQAVQAGTNLQKQSAKSKDCGSPLLVGNLPNPDDSASRDAGYQDRTRRRNCFHRSFN